MADEKLADAGRPRASKPSRRAGIVAVLLAVAGLAAGVASVAFDLGWALWIVALVAIGLALVLALSGARRLAVVGALVAVVIVAGGIIWARSAPPLPDGAIALPSAMAGEDTEDVDEDVRIVIDDAEQAVVGFSLEGERLWANTEAYAESRSAVLTGGSVVTYGAFGPDAAPATALSAATGEVEWSVDVGHANPFTANDEVIVFTDGERTVALDRVTGEPRWELAAGAYASTEGPPKLYDSYDPGRWRPGAEWMVVGDAAVGEFQVVDARTGDAVLEFTSGPTVIGRWVIAGDSFVAFDDDVEPTATATPLNGGSGWEREVLLDSDGYFEPIGDEVRIVHDDSVQWLDARTGELTLVEVPEGWTVSTGGAWLHGARTLVVERRDRDRNLLDVGLLDSATGDLTEVAGHPGRGARIIGNTPSGTLVSLPYRDAVGDAHDRAVLIPE